MGALARPTGKKLHQVQSTFVYTDKEETLRMTHRVTRRLGGYCRENYPRVYQSPRFNAIAACRLHPVGCSAPTMAQLGRFARALHRLPAHPAD